MFWKGSGPQFYELMSSESKLSESEKVLSGFDIDIFKPLVVSVEFLDLKMRKLEYKNNDIQNVLNSNIYKYFINKNYYFVNWLHGDLIFVHRDLRD